jgi:hypothetical protein
VLALHDQSYGPCHIARATGISRKQMARLLASAQGVTRCSAIGGVITLACGATEYRAACDALEWS